MSFRDEVEAARARAVALRARAEGDAEAASELAQLEARIDEARGRALKVLDDVRVATPCPASWAAMAGDDRVRHCALCEKNVYDLSGLTALEAVHLLAANERGVCVRLHRRRDGTVITADCSVGRRRRRKRWLTGAAASLAIGGAVGLASAHDESPRMQAPPLVESERVFDEEAFRSGPHVPDGRGFDPRSLGQDLAMGLMVLPSPTDPPAVLGEVLRNYRELTPAPARDPSADEAEPARRR